MQEEPYLMVQHNQTATHEMMAISFDPRWETDHLLAMPFDQYQRYRLTAELVTALKLAASATDQRWRVLDVGGYFPTDNGILPLPSFMPDDDVLVVDTVDFDGVYYQQASGTELPFEDDSFDVVVTCDTLEHIPFEGRGAFLRELRRVASRAVVLAAPHATPGVHSAELALAEYLRSFAYTNQMLNEHHQYGIPEPEWVDTWLHEHNAQFIAFPSGYLPRWQLMMMLKHQLIALPDAHYQHRRLDQTYNRRFYERDQRGPGYRRAYVIATTGEVSPALQMFVDRAARPEPTDIAAELLEVIVAPVIRALTHITQLHQRYEQLEQHYQQLSAAYAQLSEAQTTISKQYHEAVYAAGMMEGEKHVLQQQLDMLRWQNELLHQRPTGLGQQLISSARRVLHRLRRATSTSRNHE